MSSSRVYGPPSVIGARKDFLCSALRYLVIGPRSPVVAFFGWRFQGLSIWVWGMLNCRESVRSRRERKEQTLTAFSCRRVVIPCPTRMKCSSTSVAVCSPWSSAGFPDIRISLSFILKTTLTLSSRARSSTVGRMTVWKLRE